MKRRLSAILAVVLALAVVLPLAAGAEAPADDPAVVDAPSAAADAQSAAVDEQMKTAIQVVKDAFSIPPGMEFRSHVNTYNGTATFYLEWYSQPDPDQYISYSAAVDQDGHIQSYSHYAGEQSGRELPALSRAAAEEKALEQIRRIDASMISEPNGLLPRTEIGAYPQDTNYSFSYWRTVNGIPFYANTVDLQVSKGTGEVTGCYINWDYKSEFPPGAPGDDEAARAAYIQNMGLKLIYKYHYDYRSNDLQVYSVYVPVYDNDSFVLDAKTGERIEIGPMLYNYIGGMGAAPEAPMDKTADQALSPEEQQAVDKVAGLMTREAAEAAVRKLPFVGLSDSYRLEHAHLYPSWPVQEDYIWSLTFTEAKDTGEQESSAVYEYPASIYVGLDAKTGMVRNFNHYNNYGYYGDKPLPPAIYTKDQLKAKADQFLQDYYRTYTDQVVFVEADGNSVRDRSSSLINFSYNRVVNGVEFVDNSLNVAYDDITGDLVSFNMNWFDAEFPSVENVLPLEKAYEALWANIGLALEYRYLGVQEEEPASAAAAAEAGIVPPMPIPTNRGKIGLVYALKPNMPLFLDAHTGAVLDYSGEPYESNAVPVYTDIEDSYAKEQIQTLLDIGIYLPGNEFRPDEAITQQDFLTLLAKTFSYGSVRPYPYGMDFSPANLTNFFGGAVGLLKEGEAAPDAPVTREDAVKFIVRAMKLDKVADLGDIFKESDFADRDQISAELEPYVIIASGLGIVRGYDGSFHPKDSITRAAAAIVICNYLQVAD